MPRTRTLNFLACALIAGCTAAVPIGDPTPLITAFNGVARIGPDTHSVIFHYDCSSISGPMITGVLAVQSMIPRYARSRPLFDFDLLKGPSAKAGSSSVLQTSSGSGTVTGRFAPTGTTSGGGVGAWFLLDVSAALPEPVPLRKLVAVQRPLT